MALMNFYQPIVFFCCALHVLPVPHMELVERYFYRKKPDPSMTFYQDRRFAQEFCPPHGAGDVSPLLANMHPIGIVLTGVVNAHTMVRSHQPLDCDWEHGHYCKCYVHRVYWQVK